MFYFSLCSKFHVNKGLGRANIGIFSLLEIWLQIQKSEKNQLDATNVLQGLPIVDSFRM